MSDILQYISLPRQLNSLANLNMPRFRLGGSVVIAEI
jgi:hypothetical protein